MGKWIYEKQHWQTGRQVLGLDEYSVDLHARVPAFCALAYAALAPTMA